MPITKGRGTSPSVSVPFSTGACICLRSLSHEDLKNCPCLGQLVPRENQANPTCLGAETAFVPLSQTYRRGTWDRKAKFQPKGTRRARQFG